MIAESLASSGITPAVIGGYLEFLASHSTQITQLIVEHLVITLLTIGIALPMGVLLGTFISLYEWAATPILWFAGIMQTIPSIALFGLLIPFLGIGSPPVIISLVLYSQLPIVRNTHIGLTQVDEAAIEAGRGLGMGRLSRLRRVQIPLALPVVMAGVRNAVVIIVGIAAIGAFIGAGGLGDYLFQGIRERNVDMIVVTTVILSALALALDYGFGLSERLLRARNGEEIQSTRLTRIFQQVIA
ncbi:ABC transporter permease [Haloferax denitrificans]|uniref:Binding-protein-dependent transport systems inner membrane component n=1 Tax=Haloferax denitrificans ATCC 35960 TaxID=662478 RepID=M0JEX0_9EURY|nr:ABC transporter permease [Haloferax denitrificans]EMA06913.1 binding-protein-dependent transport systems inner membrane component [Haloferax denitrificans ATCC 35960]